MLLLYFILCFSSTIQVYADLFSSNSGRLSRQSPRISAQKCEDYKKLSVRKTGLIRLTLRSRPIISSVSTCDTKVSLIVGGENAKSGEFPHMAALGYYNNDNELEFKCGGSLISDEYVLTASHCYGEKIPDIVRLGQLSVLEDDGNGDDCKVETFIVHPDYNIKTKANDIALIRLNRKVQFSNYIKPICLWQKSYIDTEKAIATGYGHTSFGGESSKKLMKVSLEILDKTTCKAKHETKKKKLIDSQFCAGDRGDVKHDTCQGDSGGPLQVGLDDARCIYHILGVTSFGKVCGVAPGVYTSVYPYLDWIEGIVWPK